MTKLFLVLPCYNEEAVLPETARQLSAVMSQLQQSGRISEESRVVFVDDGSRDNTWQIISELHAVDKLFTGIRLSRNRGHQNALLAGLMTVKDRCDVTISMDADLQDDPSAIPLFLDAFEQGNEIVYGVRNDRTRDSFFKRATAQSYYKLLANMGVEVVYNHADCRLMSAKALQLLAEYEETHLFLRGLVPQIGLSSTTVSYSRQARFAGESKYPLKKMVKLAVDGITSFSMKPLKLLRSFGILLVLLGGGFLAGGLIALLLGAPVSDVIWLLGGISLLLSLPQFSLWMLGEYVGRAYLEGKKRPRFFVWEDLG